MKRYTSRFLKAVALAYLAFPMSYLLMAALLFDIPGKQCVRILLSPSYYVLSAGAMIAGYGLWEMKRWAWYLFITVSVVIVYTNAIVVSDYGTTHHKAVAFVAAALGIGLLVYRVSREVRVPYFLPKIQWWESNPRFKLTLPVKIHRKEGGDFPAEILDLSVGGCFIKSKNEFPLDETLTVSFRVFGEEVECPGTIVWRTQSTVTHPKGMGVKFSSLTRTQRRTLRAITIRLKKISALYRMVRSESNPEPYLAQIEALQSEPLSQVAVSRSEA